MQIRCAAPASCTVTVAFRGKMVGWTAVCFRGKEEEQNLLKMMIYLLCTDRGPWAAALGGPLVLLRLKSERPEMAK